jgi:hypothetical protein
MSDTRVCYHAALSTDGVVAAIEFSPAASSPGGPPGVPPTTRPNAAWPRRRTLAQAMQAQHTRHDEIAMLRFALLCQPTDLARNIGSRQRLVFWYVHQSTSDGSGITPPRTKSLCTASAFHPACVLLRVLPNSRVWRPSTTSCSA